MRHFTSSKKGAKRHWGEAQILTKPIYTDFLRAATGKALTMVRAGLAFTSITLPNTSRLPAFVAGFKRVFTMHTPGMVNLPFLISWAATSARAARALVAWLFLISAASARTSAMPVLVMALTALPAFIAFIGAICVGSAREGW